MSEHMAKGLGPMRGRLFLYVILLGVVFVTANGYRPVIIIHGLFDGPKQFINLTSFINKTHPGTNVTTVDMYDDMASLKPLWKQVRGIKKVIEPIMEHAKDGVHLICFSQGGLVCRGLIATLSKHNVHSLIFLSSPLSGQYGEWRENFLAIKKLVLIGGPDDGVITPWQSSRMTSRRKTEECRICGGNLQGNQRRWLFAAQNKNRAQNQSPTRSLCKESPYPLSPAISAQSSPWGSTMSLGSSKSHTFSTSNKGMDLLAVLTHILEQSVPRGDGKEEFVCGKCVSVLERVFKFDTVIARVRILSRERLQKLIQERDKLRWWVRSHYSQRYPSKLKSTGSSSEDDVELGESNPGRAYQEMLGDNMALAAYECWTEKAETCPYFRRTGKRCSKLKNCECCDSLRVSDFNYENVCGVPRHLPEEVRSQSNLSRDKSQSMPLHWSRALSVRSSPASLSGSCHSLKTRSRTVSAHSLDSVDDHDPFDWPDENSLILDSILYKLKHIEGKPVRSPIGSRIPVLAKGPNGHLADGPPPVKVTRVLSFGQGDDQEEEDVNGEREDVLTELRDEFLPLHREGTTFRAHLVVKQLQEQLNQAQARIRTLEAGLQNSSHSDSSKTQQLLKESTSVYPNSSSGDEASLVRSLSYSLQSRDKVIQECVTLIRKLCVDLGSGLEEADKLISSVTAVLTDTHSEREVVLEAELTESKEKEKSLQKELEALHEANRGQERDLLTLNSVLQCNRDVINHLRVELAEKTQSLQDVQKERELRKERDSALERVLLEKEALIICLQQAVESSFNDVQALSDSLISRGLPGGDAEGALASQVKEQESLLSVCLKDWETHTVTTSQEVSKLCTALDKAEAIIQNQRQSHKQAITELSEQLRDSHKELREMLKIAKQAEQGWKAEKAKRDKEEGRLREGLQKRDKVIEQVLLDAEKRDGMLIELHQDIFSKVQPIVGLKQTL
ncbi:Lysosomal thioesterase PPT2-A [Bagarius yarrelli]|uniref:Lysosomal thioesterase PPT2-A n=1 Tax=Bagarius yarrelli TaxID=175774 RepID=A0A556U5X8_BAGYA|nr:Lysosomal thioesterase PPT2-A [Bagarius yarrelli]